MKQGISNTKGRNYVSTIEIAQSRCELSYAAGGDMFDCFQQGLNHWYVLSGNE
ncbi:hypothetical protein VIBNIAM115_1260023 [Vibrio nigripulchritudo AM115]|nr:hypothetical protein VIBNIAM115_1260023 [Vibrio nigripulchritudo AM115]